MSHPPPAYHKDNAGFPPGYGMDSQYPPAYSNYGDPLTAQPPPPPPGYGYPPTGQTPVIISQPMVNLVQTFRDQPVRMLCPFCQADIVTATYFETGAFTWLICVLLCFCIGIFGLIPFCVDGCKDVVHHCPSCKQSVGRYSRM